MRPLPHDLICTVRSLAAWRGLEDSGKEGAIQIAEVMVGLT